MSSSCSLSAQTLSAVLTQRIERELKKVKIFKKSLFL